MNVRGVKGKKRKRKTKPDSLAQSARFIEAAKSMGIESGEAFERAMDALVPRKQAKKKK
ncbi:MAG TPA: hypothetical protein VMT94_05345 [Burkholderiales bacterium]|nr:hypothetical protein [Burkholderiales bacterium]